MPDSLASLRRKARDRIAKIGAVELRVFVNFSGEKTFAEGAHLRLQEARRLMLGEDMDVASAGFRVGYEDPSHFSREYKRHFGAPPHRRYREPA